MLTDLGLQTPEQIKEYNEYFKNRPFQGGGCVGSRICENCNHLISDSICLCIGIFDCPNCGFKNGTEIERQFEEARKSPTIPFNNTNGIIWPTLQGRLNNSLTTESEALQQLEKFVPLSEEGKERLEELLKK